MCVTDACLKFSGASLELIHDKNTYEYVRSAKRGGVSSVSKRFECTKEVIMYICMCVCVYMYVYAFTYTHVYLCM